mmetsp:Transcript_9136/g.15826  ORF Transcript_9136/g.15826 Transcript_9136/m.15826 type:complete len:602 (+) Transcript_9136:77-1882(+)
MTKSPTMASLALILLLSCSSTSSDDGLEKMLQETEFDDTCSLLQVQLLQQDEVRFTNMATEGGMAIQGGSRKLSLPKRVQLLYTGMATKAGEPFLPVTICIFVMAILLVLLFVHNFIQVAFHNLPFISSMAMLSLLAVFCFTMCPVMLNEPGKVLTACGTLVLFSSYMSILILMFTPLILIMPEHSTSSLVSYYLLGSTKTETYSPKVRGNKKKLAILFLIIFCFQVASGVSVFMVASFAGQTGFDGDLAGPSMIVFVYAILAWFSLFVIYERMFPLRSFAADFPGLIMTYAFMDRASWQKRDNGLQGRLSGMKEAVDKISEESKATKTVVKDFCKYMSSAITDVESDILLQGTGITSEVAFVKGAIDDTKLGKWTHYILWGLYGVFCVAFAIVMGVRLSKAVMEHDDMLWAMLWIVVGMFCLFLLLVVLLEIIIHEGSFGGMSSGPDGKAEAEEAAGAKLFGVREFPAASATSPYLNGLIGLQSEIESRIAEHTGQTSPETITSKSDLATVLFKRGDFEAAEKLYREVWEFKNATLGPDHSDTLLSKENVANAVLWCGDSATAERLYREVWEARTRIFGPEHPETLSTKYRLERCTEKIM